MGIGNVAETKLTARLRSAAEALGDKNLVTSELLIWLHMIHHAAAGREQGGGGQGHDSNEPGFFAPYLLSLGDVSPSPLSWPPDLREAFGGTNLLSLLDAEGSLEKQITFLQQAREQWASTRPPSCEEEGWLPESIFNLKNLVWARGHYLARRYPGRFATGESQLEGREALDGREVGLQQLGSMVPLLDCLNHNPAEEWLSFVVTPDILKVVCNYPVAKGKEIFANYGQQSSERLLYAYGFALEDNDHDAVALRLMGKQQGVQGEKYLGTYYIQEGDLNGVPPVSDEQKKG